MTQFAAIRGGPRCPSGSEHSRDTTFDSQTHSLSQELRKYCGDVPHRARGGTWWTLLSHNTSHRRHLVLSCKDTGCWTFCKTSHWSKTSYSGTGWSTDEKKEERPSRKCRMWPSTQRVQKDPGSPVQAAAPAPAWPSPFPTDPCRSPQIRTPLYLHTRQSPSPLTIHPCRSEPTHSLSKQEQSWKATRWRGSPVDNSTHAHYFGRLSSRLGDHTGLAPKHPYGKEPPNTGGTMSCHWDGLLPAPAPACPFSAPAPTSSLPSSQHTSSCTWPWALASPPVTNQTGFGVLCQWVGISNAKMCIPQPNPFDGNSVLLSSWRTLYPLFDMFMNL